MAIHVNQEIPVYEIGGKDTGLGTRFGGNVQIRSHWNRDAWVILIIADEEYTVEVAVY